MQLLPSFRYINYHTPHQVSHQAPQEAKDHHHEKEHCRDRSRRSRRYRYSSNQPEYTGAARPLLQL
jgi:hypothetical protein